MKYKFLNMKYKYLFITMFLFTIVFIPSTIFAASINISSGDKVGAGDTGVIDIYLNTEGQNINSIDGSVVLSDEHDGNFEVKDLSLSNSAFTMWPRKPSLENGHKIYFVGGVPGGVNGERVLLFKIVVKINETGDFKITPNQLVAYLNDGLGTSVKIPENSSIISIGKSGDEIKDKWKEIVSNDNIAPEPFEIILSEDPNLFDGKKFIFFDTTDAQSGIAYYEVREDGFPPVRATTNYVLINQDKDVDIIVTAYDKAGNFQVATLKMKGSINWLGIVVALAIIITSYQILKRVVKKRKKHAKKNP
jgi:hypothetical protein